ncbi:SOH1-domain-containing protein [Coccomyxa subellipsoidea C-169]|uniref:Mediator of RNA polymerase II transcription subunit 31 n=1 Tax=Coccomyxa subellipsoidea (strain C-169) TaxID=574566 RepID=I0Z5N6_COCSC|nr:SOH1-domain-containing protein [Coccomyxa subellipsoidea C-169]EIE25955.1 SOH1-domain-containing protein [Coccomyxa subellipsoidea C-169]|eukprot:XP_005650499.1 SOH1-domain-containing protein [Coccomyxa subellipsoidea C-169]
MAALPDERRRFELELEFINSLANPQYVQWIAQTYGNDTSFLEYLQYLLYWKQPQFAKYIIYPHSLHFLGLLQSPEFRTAVALAPVRELIENQQFFMWQHFRKDRELSHEGSNASADQR